MKKTSEIAINDQKKLGSKVSVGEYGTVVAHSPYKKNGLS